MEESDELFAFNRTDKDAILASLAQVGGFDETQKRTPPFAILLGKTKAGGLPANGTGFVFYMEPIAASPYWQVTTTEYPVFNRGLAIGGAKDVLLIPVNGRWLTVEICV